MIEKNNVPIKTFSKPEIVEINGEILETLRFQNMKYSAYKSNSRRLKKGGVG